MLSVMAVVVCLAGARVLAHLVTYKGTVISVAKDKVVVDVIDEKTKKATPRTFDVDAETQVFRGEVAVKFADARIEKGESIAVTVNLDDSDTFADVIKLPAKK
jgi:hypothetical protein